MGPTLRVDLGDSRLKTQGRILWLNDHRLAFRRGVACDLPPVHDSGHSSGLSQLVVSREPSSFPGVDIWGLGFGDRNAILNLVETVVAGSADLLVGMVLGNFEFLINR